MRSRSARAYHFRTPISTLIHVTALVWLETTQLTRHESAEDGGCIPDPALFADRARLLPKGARLSWSGRRRAVRAVRRTSGLSSPSGDGS